MDFLGTRGRAKQFTGHLHATVWGTHHLPSLWDDGPGTGPWRCRVHPRALAPVLGASLGHSILSHQGVLINMEGSPATRTRPLLGPVAVRTFPLWLCRERVWLLVRVTHTPLLHPSKGSGSDPRRGCPDMRARLGERYKGQKRKHGGDRGRPGSLQLWGVRLPWPRGALIFHPLFHDTFSKTWRIRESARKGDQHTHHNKGGGYICRSSTRTDGSV